MLAACARPAATQTNANAEAPLVTIVAAAPAASPNSVRASGLVGYKHEPMLAFNTPGVIASISVDSGDVVRRGQRLATLRRVSVGANADEATLARQNAERDLARTQQLFEQGFVSQARLDDARLAVERARDSSALVAPADGVILRREADPAQMVAAGAPVLSFGDTASGIIVRAPIASADAARIRVGDAASVTLPELSGAHEAHVSRIAAKSNDATGAFDVEVEVTAPQGLRSGMVADVTIQTSTNATAGNSPGLLVPMLSLLDARADQGVVFVVDARNIAHRHSVRTAGVSEAGVVVVEGLAPGDRVVATGAAYVRDGEPVRIGASG
jgi:RND family efflux transporter MFP subunit